MAAKRKKRLSIAHSMSAIAKCLIFNDFAKGRLLACKKRPFGV